mgnify:CR=1 FL=1
MTRRLISSGSPFEAEYGYSRAVVDGDWVFVAGTTGYDYAKMELSDDAAEQCEQTFRNITSALEQAGASLADVVRVTYILPNRDDWASCTPITRRYFGDIRPAATMFVAQLQSEKMKIEIEVTAKKRT